IKGVSREAMEVMQGYRWPGNVRELVNTVERAVSFADSDTIEARDLPEHIRDQARHAPVRPPAAAMATAGGTNPALRIPTSPGISAPPAPMAGPPPESFESTFK